MSKINPNIFIVEDDTEVCCALKYLFESVQFNVEIYKNADLFLENFNYTVEGCLIVDVRLPGMSGLELLEQLKQNKNSLPVIVITGYGDIQMAVRAMKAGATDYVLKPFNDQCLLESVQKQIDDSSKNYSWKLINKQLNEKINSLSSREHQIIDLILDGKLNKEIAYELNISMSTVEAHRASIMHKMEAKTVAHFIKMYLQAQNNRALL
ncbi:response regulator transcription factor [Legionella rowbothamii]|uniref:response regulator transcription factor n=1 Tax=Legionella rowbothamii TaxID=96229 RepID=UPI001054E2A3|nr:response regulator [Legionella rowbothamii]